MDGIYILVKLTHILMSHLLMETTKLVKGTISISGHRSIAYDEQPEKTRASASNRRRSTRKPVSLALNAFLNSQVTI